MEFKRKNILNNSFSTNFKESAGLFVLLMLVFSIFAHTIGDNENSRLDTTISIVEENKLSIDRIHNNTGDKSIINGSYYSDKAPLPSFLAIPGYALVSSQFNETVKNKSYSNTFRRSYSSKMEWGRFAATVTVSSLAGALTSVIFYLFSINSGLRRDESIFVGFLTGLATLVFPYSTTFHGTMLGTLFLTGAVFLWFNEDFNASTRKTFLIGLLIGLGVSSSYLIVVPGAIILSINSLERLENIRLHLFGLFGLFTGLLPLLIFNYLTTGNPFEPTAFHSVDPYPGHPIEGYLFEVSASKISIARIIRALISPLNGLFIYCPVLVFGLIGLRNFYSDRKKLLLLISGTLIATLILISFIPLWPIRAYYGPRYLLPASTLLILPLIYEYKKSGGFEKTLIYFSSIISSIIMFASTQTWSGSSWINPRGIHSVKMTTLGIYENRLWDYLTSLPTEGLQSPIISYLTGTSTNFHMVLSPYPQYGFPLTLFDQLFTIDMRAFSIGIIALSFVLLFKKYFDINKYNLAAGFSLVLILVVFGVSAHSNYMHDWYDQQEQETLQWGREEPDIYFSSDNTNKRVISIQARALEKQEFKIYHNGDLIGNRTLNSRVSNISEIIDPKKGLNRISFRTEECNVMGRFADNNDIRCVTLGLKAYNFEGSQKEVILDNFRPESSDNKLLGENSRVLIGSDPGKYSLVLTIASNETTKISASADNEEIFSSRVDRFPTVIRTPYFHSTGMDWIEFEKSCESCKVKIEDIRLKNYKNENQTIRKSTGWYRKVDTEDLTWTSGNSTVLIYNHRNESVRRKITLDGRSFDKTRNISFEVNDNAIKNITMPTTFYRILSNGTRTVNAHSFNVELNPGENILELTTNEACSVIGETIGNDDIRCAAYGIGDIRLTDQ